MGAHETLALLPLIVLSGTAPALLMAIALYRRHGLVFGITLLGFAATVAAAVVITVIAAPVGSVAAATAPIVLPQQVGALLRIDNYALFFTGLLAGAGFFITLLSYGYWERRGGAREEYYLLLMLGTAGGVVLAASSHFASLFLGLELMSVAIFALAAYDRANRLGLEAGIKYLVLAGVSSALILFGIALIYTELGTMQLAEVVVRTVGKNPQPVFMTGAAMVLAGVGFKLALFPFHLWAPDVFEGAPAPVTAFLATVSKGAVFAVLVRYFFPLQALENLPFLPGLVFLAIASMFAGNLLALRQLKLKRLLAYSSIAHMGYLLIPLIARTSGGIQVIIFYLTTYFITTLGAFGVIAMLSRRERDFDRSDDYRGLAWRHPWLAAVLTGCMMSLAGLPVTAGFMGKFFIVLAGVGAATGIIEPAVMGPTLWTLVIVLAINSGLSLYYYLRVARELYRRPDAAPLAPAPALSWAGGIALAALALLLLWLGVYPSPLLRVIETTVQVFTPAPVNAGGGQSPRQSFLIPEAFPSYWRLIQRNK